jgi:hypothetical protein
MSATGNIDRPQYPVSTTRKYAQGKLADIIQRHSGGRQNGPVDVTLQHAGIIPAKGFGVSSATLV